MIRIMMADDHKLFIDALGNLLEQRPDMEVVGAARDGTAAVSLAKDLKPDIVLMDFSMPQLNGIEATRRITAGNSSVRVVMLSMHADRTYVVEAIRAGASGYLLKDSAQEELLEAIRHVAAGDIYLARKMSGELIRDLVLAGGEKKSSVFSLLSPREREVLQLLSEGHSTKGIAGHLSVSVKTVETHRKQIMDKLGLRSIAELTKYAIREGLTPMD
jgi:DNA-binding NarL/FixJ family response regulator